MNKTREESKPVTTIDKLERGRAGVPATQFYVGVDTHADTHTVAALDGVGRVLWTNTYPATSVGYQTVVAHLEGLGSAEEMLVGVEGTNSYGAGLTRALQGSGFEVFEVLRPTRQVRRMDGKSDPIDAVEAARALISGRGVSVPKSGAGVAESLRFLNVARNQHVSAISALSNAVLSLLVTASAQIREEYEARTTGATLQKLRNCRPGRLDAASVDFFVLTSLKTMAKTHWDLSQAATKLEERMHALLETHYPALLNLYGVGTVTAAALVTAAGDNPHRIRSEAAFAKMCGACPIPASSGKTNRHRLNRGGNRQANKALHRIAIVRLGNHEPTIEYAARQTECGKTKKEILRQLKRALCRPIYRALVDPHRAAQLSKETAHLDGKHLRKMRAEKGLTQKQVAQALDTHHTQISKIENEAKQLLRLRSEYHQLLQNGHPTPTQQTRPTPPQAHQKAA